MPRSAQKSLLDLLAGLRDHTECQGLNLCPQVQGKCPTHCSISVAPNDLFCIEVAWRNMGKVWSTWTVLREVTECTETINVH